MTVENVFTQNRRLWVRLQAACDGLPPQPRGISHAYLKRAGLRSDPKARPFRTSGRATGKPTRTVLRKQMLMQWSADASASGIETKLGDHSFPA
jgi:hypothetical protein